MTSHGDASPAPAASGSRLPAFLRLRVGLAGLFGAAALVVTAATLLGFLGGLWWFADLFAHFRVQYAAALLPLSLLLLALRQRRLAAAAAVALLLNVAVIAPLYLRPADAAGSAAVAVRVLLINVNTANGDPARVLAAVRALDPDLLLVQEISTRWVAALQALEDAYPHTLLAPRADNFGIGLYSRLPLRTPHLASFGSAEVPSVVAGVEAGGGARFTLVGTHPLPPVNRAYAAWRDEQLALVATDVARRAAGGESVVVLGDLNVTPWSARFRAFLRQAPVRDSARGFGVQPTWPVQIPVLYIPLDHCLHTPDLVTRRRVIGPAVGSDHRPLCVTLGLAAGRP
jgi:endonuclease/exonuclease/phosphatase (EEP) superfamily protein YafD